MVLVVGGHTFGPFMAKGAELYDPQAGTFAVTADPSTVRVRHTATLLPGGRVLVAGGVKSNALLDELDSAELYDSTAGTFTDTGKLNLARQSHTATLLQNGKVLIAGGFKDIKRDVIQLSTLQGAELYDPDTGEWSPTAEMNEARGEHLAVLLGGGTVLVAAGARRQNSGLHVALNGAEVFS
jgi:large repetitive protein